MVEGIQKRKIEFPIDHFTHDTLCEWWYYFGRLSNKQFFHFATFRFGYGSLETRASHWSLHNGDSRYGEEVADDFNRLKSFSTFIPKAELFTFNAPTLGLSMHPKCQPSIHKVLPHRNYYSIPSMEADGYIYPDVKVTSDVWMDHEFSDVKEFSNWDWVGVKMDCGMSIMVHNSETDKSCSVMFNDGVIHSDFILDGKHLFIHALGMYVMLEPLVEEKIFNPKFGIPYSEQPFEVISKGGVIGYGMRERTYREGRNGT